MDTDFSKIPPEAIKSANIQLMRAVGGHSGFRLCGQEFQKGPPPEAGTLQVLHWYPGPEMRSKIVAASNHWVRLGCWWRRVV